MLNMKLIIFTCLVICAPYSYGRNTQNREAPSKKLVTNKFKTIIYAVGYQPDPTLEIADISQNCEDKVCIMKCCPTGFLLKIEEPQRRPDCVPISTYNATDYVPPFEDLENVFIKSGFPYFDNPQKRPRNITCQTYSDVDAHLKSDGTIYHRHMRKWFTTEEYCIDNAFGNGSITVQSRICHNPTKEQYYNQYISKILIFIPIILSYVFLITIFVLHYISRNNSDLQKKVTLASCISLFMGFSNVLLGRIYTSVSETGCTTSALVGTFSFMSFYFWFSVMCYEISRIIRGTFKLTPISDLNEKSRRRYICYSLYGWGGPFLLCCFIIMMQFIPLSSFPTVLQPYIVKPGISKGRCWYERGLPTFLYYVLFEVILHIFNGIFMFHAAYLLYKDKISYWCSRNKVKPELRSHATGKHVEVFKLQFLIFIVYLIMLMIKAVSQVITGNQFLRLMIIILGVHSIFLFFVILQTSKNTEVAKHLDKLRSRAREIRRQICFSASKGEVTRL